MRFFTTLLLGFAYSPQLFAQSSAASAVEARQAEVVQLGQQIYRLDLGDPGWTHQLVPVCPAFKHHVFARYDHKVSGKQQSYLAIFPLDIVAHPPRKKPWLGGVVLLNLTAGDKAVAERSDTITIFNHVWGYELAHSGRAQAFPGLGWSGLARCYAIFTSETPKSQSADSTTDDSIDLEKMPVQSMTLPLQSSTKHQRSLDIEIEPNGLLKQAVIRESPLDQKLR